jgi:hypothetical protein
LNNIYETREYPFYFVALIGDKNEKAYARLKNDYNLYGYPTNLFDGGDHVVLGTSSENSLINRIKLCGLRDVHELDFILSVEWLDDRNLEIHVSITNNEEIINTPPNDVLIEGPLSGRTGVEYNYTFTANDPEKHDLVYCIDWGDGTEEIFVGPFGSWEEISVKHNWTERGTYEIKAKASDIYGAESDWSTLVIDMPKNKIVTNTPFLNFLENHPILFSLLKQLVLL